jgi:hypothetical protein
VRRQISDEERKERTQGRPHRAVVVPGTSELCLDQLSQTAAGATCVEQHMAISCVSAAVGLAPGRAQPHSSHPLLSFVCGSSGCTVFGSCSIVESDAGEEGPRAGRITEWWRLGHQMPAHETNGTATSTTPLQGSRVLRLWDRSPMQEWRRGPRAGHFWCGGAWGIGLNYRMAGTRHYGRCKPFERLCGGFGSRVQSHS